MPTSANIVPVMVHRDLPINPNRSIAVAKKNIGRPSTSKVILVSPEYPGITPSGGIGTAFKALAEHMGEEGFDVTFLIPTFQPLQDPVSYTHLRAHET